ncbi:hypothetical protein [Streptomyces sp. NPDC017435]|uniref:hypothetical protein n=1 Tax=Streptomyces sp. NPDC017435 TaxID=3364995 RepID=UPI003795E5AB
MTTQIDDFKECCRIQGGLDLEAVDVAFIQPLKDLHAWWQRQTGSTQAFVGFFGTGALTAFVAELFKTTASAVAQSFGALVAAVTLGVGLGVAMDVLGRCKIQEIEHVVDG